MREVRFLEQRHSSLSGPRVVACWLLLALPLLPACGAEAPTDRSPTTGSELLSRSIQYHDPGNVWPSLAHTLVLRQERPDGETRQTNIRLDVPSGGFAYEEDTADGNIRKGVVDGDCFASVDGAPPSQELTETLRLDCPSVERMRNYYLYLWGLPMKLRDPGTHIAAEIGRETFDDRAALSIRVTYDQNVGSDIWYFYFDPDTYRMIGYKFYHDEAAGDGEYILLRDERDVLGMQIPAVRRWFTNRDSTFLGSDHLVEDFEGQPAATYR